MFGVDVEDWNGNMLGECRLEFPYGLLSPRRSEASETALPEFWYGCKPGLTFGANWEGPEELRTCLGGIDAER